MLKIFMLFLGSFTCLLATDNHISEKKAVFCGVVKNCARFFDDNKKEIERLGSLFKDYMVVIYENNSQDNTKYVYDSWSKASSHVIFISEDLSQEYLKSYTPLVGDYRTQLISRARNKTLDIVATQAFANYDYVIVLDLDDFEPINIDEFIKTIEEPLHPWDAVFANGSYDLYSLRSNEFPCGPELLTWDLFSGMYEIGPELRKLLDQHIWYPVDSFFGGFAIYKLNAAVLSRYSGIINGFWINNLLEYNNRYNILERPKYAFFKNQIQENFNKIYQFVSTNVISQNCQIYTCEHITFNLSLKELGFNKMYINSKLTRRSRSHRNY